MSQQPNIKRNYAYNMAYQVLALLVPLVTIPYVSRVLGADGVGTYSFCLSIVTYFTLASALGVQGYGAREIACARDDRDARTRLFWELAAMVGVTTLAATAAWLALCFAVPDYTPYFLAFTPMLASVALDVSWFYIGLEKMGHVVVRNSLVKLSGLALLLAFVRTADDLVAYILVNSLVQLAGNLSMWPSLRGLVGRPPARLWLSDHFRQTLVYFVPALATSLYTVLDKTLIGLITGDPAQNGFYEQADKVVRMAMTLTFTSVNLAMGPRISYLLANGATDEARERAVRSFDFILLVGFAFAFGIAGVAEAFVPVFFGEGYGPVVGLLWMMSPLVVVVGVSNCLGSQYYIPAGKRAQSARYICAGAAANVALSLALVPAFGMYGAVAGSFAAEALITALYVSGCGGFLGWAEVWRCTWRRLLAGALALAAALALGRCVRADALVVLVAQAPAFAAVYAGALAAMRDGMLASLAGMARRRLLAGRGKGA